jgi:regulator of replication initiation timing
MKDNTPEESEEQLSIEMQYIHQQNIYLDGLRKEMNDIKAENQALKEDNQKLRESVDFLQSQIMANRNKNTSEF